MFWNFICAVFGITPSIIIGLNPDATKETRHGIATIRRLEGGNVFKVPFVVDKPEKLNAPGFWLIDSMYEQILKMGYEPVNLEFTNKRETRVYAAGKVRPIMVQPLAKAIPA